MSSYQDFNEYIKNKQNKTEYIKERLQALNGPISPAANKDEEARDFFIVAYALYLEGDKCFGFGGNSVAPKQGEKTGETFEKTVSKFIRNGKEHLELEENINLHYEEDEFDMAAQDLKTILGQHWNDYATLLEIASRSALYGDKLLSCAALRLLNSVCDAVLDCGSR